MTGEQHIQQMRVRAHGLRTATSANFAARRASLLQAIRAAGVKVAELAVSNPAMANQIGVTLRRVSHTYRAQRRPGTAAPASGSTAAPASGSTYAPASGGGGGKSASSGWQSRFSSPARGGSGSGSSGSSGGRSQAPARRSGGGGQAPARRRPPAEDAPITNRLDAPVGLLTAIERTFNHRDWPTGGLMALWSPNLPWTRRPINQLAMVSFGAGALLTVGLVVHSQMKNAPKTTAKA